MPLSETVHELPAEIKTIYCRLRRLDDSCVGDFSMRAGPREAGDSACGGIPSAWVPVGEVSEWLKEPHSKCGLRVTVAGVRIPPSPLYIHQHHE